MIRTAALAVTVAAFSSVATAQAEPAQREVVVRYGDLDLTREEGAQALLHRLEHAVEQVCSVRNTSFRDRRAVRAARACAEETMSRALAQVEAPMVQTLFAARRERTMVVSSLD